MSSSQRKPRAAKVFCVCRQAEDSRPMVLCDACGEWFHFECIGVDPDAIKDSDPFFCSTCTPKPKVTVGFGASGSPTASAPISIPRAQSARVTVAQSLPTRFQEYGTPHGSTPITASPLSGIRRPARKRTKQLTDSQTTLETLAHGHDDDDDTHSYASSFDASFDLFQRMAIGSPVPREQASPASQMTTRRRARGYSLPITPKGEKRQGSALNRSDPSSSTIKSPQPPVSSDSEDDSGDEGGNGSRNDTHKRVFHNQRERIRRSTIRTLFDNLRKNVPAVENQEGTSDRQILVEAVHHINDLELEEKQSEEQVLLLRLENLRLRLQVERLEATKCEAHTFQAIAKAAEIASLEASIEATVEEHRMLLQHPVFTRRLHDSLGTDHTPEGSPRSSLDDSFRSNGSHQASGNGFAASAAKNPALLSLVQAADLIFKDLSMVSSSSQPDELDTSQHHYDDEDDEVDHEEQTFELDE